MKGRSADGLRTLRRVRAKEEDSHRGRDARGLRINFPYQQPLRVEVATALWSLQPMVWATYSVQP